MSDDVTRIEGITSKLMTEISRVVDRLLELDHVDGHVGILNHSIAADIISQQAERDDRISAVVAISILARLLRRTVEANGLPVRADLLAAPGHAVFRECQASSDREDPSRH